MLLISTRLQRQADPGVSQATFQRLRDCMVIDPSESRNDLYYEQFWSARASDLGRLLELKSQSTSTKWNNEYFLCTECK